MNWFQVAVEAMVEMGSQGYLQAHGNVIAPTPVVINRKNTLYTCSLLLNVHFITIVVVLCLMTPSSFY